MRPIWWVLLAAIVFWFLFRRSLQEWYAKQASGLQAAQDAATLNGYTTYNTQIWSPPLWQPIVNFFKAGAYVPASSSGSASGQTIQYSVQG